jgi:hypothetical protein
MAESGAQAALRGYRLQALYTLYRIFEGDENVVFHLEGNYEDLDVYSANGELLEVNQVKAIDGNLTLSSLFPKKKQSFFRRVLKLGSLHPTAEQNLISFGTVGPQMASGWANNGSDRNDIVKSLKDQSYTSIEALQIVSNVKLVLVSERELQAIVFEKLRETITGCDPKVAFDYLHGWWLFEAEKKSRITHKELNACLVAIGRFTSELAAYHQVWFSTIVPIIDDIQSDTEDLAKEFYRGVSAQYKHILAGVDIERLERLEEIQQAFSISKLVILRGASGQGKSALAYRYLHDYVPSVWRFEIRALDNHQHAQTVANALSGHLRAIGGIAYVYIDVAPGSTTWVRLAAELTQLENIRVLVTVREEDWHRANTEGVLLTFKDIELRFEENEAHPLFNRLVERYTPSHVLTFEEAWQRFGQEGPLLEFVYFVRENETLRARLSSQVNRLRDDVRLNKIDKAEMEMLCRVSVAAAFGARLNLTALAKELELPDVRRTVELLENEYLVRQIEDGRLVDGLHPIRSTILVELLTDQDFNPWSEVAASCLTAIVESDLEIFLLHAFSRKRDQIELLLENLEKFNPASFIGQAGVFRALLWLGVQNYVIENLDLIRDTYKLFGSGWYMALMPDIGNVNQIAPGLMRPMIEELDFVPIDNRQAAMNFRQRLTSLNTIFEQAQSFLKNQISQIMPPTMLSDWVAFGELIFFSGHFKLGVVSGLWVSIDQIEKAVETLPLDVSADLVYAISFSPDQSHQSLLSSVSLKLLERFQVETQTPAIEDDGHTIRAHFLIDPVYVAGTDDLSAVNQEDSKNIIHDETMYRVNLLRRIIPNREAYGSQGYGHTGGLIPLLQDDSTKKGIPARMLPPVWATSLFSRFMRLGEYQFRPNNWKEYSQYIYQMRMQSIKALESLIEVLNLHFRRKSILELVNKSFLAVWDKANEAVDRYPHFPTDAVDEWGFIAEGMEQATQPIDGSGINPRVRNALALAKHKPYLDSQRIYANQLGNFYRQAKQALQIVPYLGRTTDPNVLDKIREWCDQNNIPEDVGRLPTINLTDVLKELPRFQREFKVRFSAFFSSAELELLERRELAIFTQAFSLWCLFVEHPNRSGIQHANQDAERRYKAAFDQVRKQIRKAFKILEIRGIKGNIHSEKVLWNEESTLWITFDIDEPTELYSAFEVIYFAVIGVLPRGLDFKLEHRAVLIYWSNLWITPLVRGKALGKIGWRFNMNTLVVDPPMTPDRWYNFAIQQIPNSVWDSLGLELWDHPRLEVAQRLSAATVQTGLLVGHMASLEKLVEITTTEIGQSVLLKYANEQEARVSKTFQRVFDTLSEVAQFFNDNIEDFSSNSRLRTMLESLNTVAPKLSSGLDSSGQTRMSLADMSTLLNQIREAIPAFEYFYLEWVGDILDQISPVQHQITQVSDNNPFEKWKGRLGGMATLEDAVAWQRDLRDDE